MMYPTGTLPAEITGGAAYLCDACLDLLVKRGVVDEAGLAEAQGAPPAWVAWRRAKAAAARARARG
jgi:hypothetical protein